MASERVSKNSTRSSIGSEPWAMPAMRQASKSAGFTRRRRSMPMLRIARTEPAMLTRSCGSFRITTRRSSSAVGRSSASWGTIRRKVQGPPHPVKRGSRGGRAMSFQGTEWIWRNGEWIRWEDATIHVLSHVVHYGSSVFEGIRCYATPQGPAIFRLPEHMRRFRDSAKIYRMEMPDMETLEEACKEVVVRNE